MLGILRTQSLVELAQLSLLLGDTARFLPPSLQQNPELVWDAHFPTEVGEAGILPELGEERMGLYRERPDVSLGRFIEGLEGIVYLAQRSVNENL